MTPKTHCTYETPNPYYLAGDKTIKEKYNSLSKRIV